MLENYFEVIYPQLARGKDGSSRTEIIFAGLVPNPAYGYGTALKGMCGTEGCWENILYLKL